MAQSYAVTVHVWPDWGKHVPILQLFCLLLRLTNRLNKDISCTSQACAWLPPAHMQNVKYAPISDINFTAPSTKRKNITGKSARQSTKQSSLPSPSQEEISRFFSELSKTDKPALLSIIPEYSDVYVVDHSIKSQPLPALFSIRTV